LIFGRISSSISISFKEDGSKIDTQQVFYQDYDEYGNVLHQRVDTYNAEGIAPENILSHKIIESTFEGTVDIELQDGTILIDQPCEFAKRRGTAIETKVSQYDGTYVVDDGSVLYDENGIIVFREDISTQVDEVTTTVDIIDYRGYSVRQITDTKVVDRLITVPELKLANRRVIENLEIDNKGDAKIQKIWTYQTDESGGFIVDSITGNKMTASFQVITNREFDSRHNVRNQRVHTYTESGVSGFLLDVQEIRSLGHHYSGVALHQVIATYAENERGESELLDVKVVVNEEVNSRGWAARSITTTYNECVILDGGVGSIEVALSSASSRQIVEAQGENAFDIRGNALNQTITREYFRGLDYLIDVGKNEIVIDLTTPPLDGEVLEVEFSDGRIFTIDEFDGEAKEFVIEVHQGSLENVGYQVYLSDELLSESSFFFSEIQDINNGSYDFHDRLRDSIVTNYWDPDKAKVADRQIVSYDVYDMFGNVLAQRIDTEIPINENDIELGFQFSECKVVVNEFENAFAIRRGNSTRTEIIRYDAIDAVSEEPVLIEDSTYHVYEEVAGGDLNRIDLVVIITDTSDFDWRGYALKTTTDTFVMDRVYDASGETLISTSEKLATERISRNIGINNRGDAGVQKVILYTTDDTGGFIYKKDASGDYIYELDEVGVPVKVKEATSYQVMTNRKFNTRHNIENQKIITYTEPGDDGFILDVQEIRSSGFHSSGVAHIQIASMYWQQNQNSPLQKMDTKVMVNDLIDSRGNVKEIELTRYSEWIIMDDNEGDIIVDLGSQIEHQIIKTSSFDLRGNALSQTTIGDDYRQEITSSGFDFHDRKSSSVILSYEGEDGDVFIDRQNIYIYSYDVYGNIEHQVVDSFEDINATIFTERKVITNIYDNVDGSVIVAMQDEAGNIFENIGAHIAARRGQAVVTDILRYNSMTEELANELDRQNIVTTMIDWRGYAVDQTIDAFAVDEVDNTEKMTSQSVIHNSSITPRGDARLQSMITRGTDSSGENLGDISYQKIINIKFDSQHNVLEKWTGEYSDVSMTELVSFQRISNTGFGFRGSITEYIADRYYVKEDENIYLFDTQVIVETEHFGRLGATSKTTVTSYVTDGDAVLSQDGLFFALMEVSGHEELLPLAKTVTSTTAWGARDPKLATGQVMGKYGFNLEEGVYEWISEVASSYTYEFHGFITSSESITSVAQDVYETVHLEKPVDVVKSHKVVSVMGEVFDRFGNAESQTTTNYNWIIGEPDGSWQKMETLNRINDLDLVDSNGRITYYEETVTSEADDVITTNEVEILSFDYKGRQRESETTSNRSGEENNILVLDETTWTNKVISEYDRFDRAISYVESSRSSLSGSKVEEIISNGSAVINIFEEGFFGEGKPFRIYVNGNLASKDDYSVDIENGILTFSSNIPLEGDSIRVEVDGIATLRDVSDITYYANGNMKSYSELSMRSDISMLTESVKYSMQYDYLDRLIGDISSARQYDDIAGVDFTVFTERDKVVYNDLSKMTSYETITWSSSAPDSANVTETKSIVYDSLGRISSSETIDIEGTSAYEAISRIERAFSGFDELTESEKYERLEGITSSLGFKEGDIHEDTLTSIVEHGVNGLVNWLKNKAIFIASAVQNALSYLAQLASGMITKFDELSLRNFVCSSL